MKIDREKAQRYGLSTMVFASTIRTALYGKEISDFKIGEEEYPIEIRLSEPYRLRQFAAEEVDEWCARIVAAHYERLSSLACDVCLVADHRSLKRDLTGSIISRSSTVFGLGLPEPDAAWTWNIAPLGKENLHTSKELIVGAWHLVPATHGPLP